MNRRFQFSLRSLLVVILVAASFLGGIHFERERRRRADELEEARLQKVFELGWGNYHVEIIDDLGPRDDDRDTTQGWRKVHAEAVETLGFGR